MDDLAQMVSDRLWWFVFGLFALFSGLLVLSLVQPTPDTRACISNSRPSGSTRYSYDGINVVSSALATAADEVSATLISTAKVAGCGSGSITTTIASVGLSLGRSAANVAIFVGQSIGSGAVFMAQGVSKGIALILYVPGSVLGFVADTPVVSAMIKPATLTQTPVIVSLQEPPAEHATLANAKTAGAITHQNDTTPSWPIHGIITTEFGVPEWPYQPIHTGIDISDGARPGVTPIHPFKPGRVIDVIHSSSGLGNHVVVDHGNGLTSVYGHMHSTSVQIGQIVDKSTVLGYEGSTGVSTGTHVHFEIRVNGSVVNPHLYISGQP
jgi:hypothetical protein